MWAGPESGQTTTVARAISANSCFSVVAPTRLTAGCPAAATIASPYSFSSGVGPPVMTVPAP